MTESEVLIMTIEKYPCLWHIHHDNYHNKAVKDMAWEQICKELFRDWNSRKNKADKIAEVKKKWTNIRDYYRKEVLNTRNTPKKKYVYSEFLQFLNPMFGKKDTEKDKNSSNDDDTSSGPLEAIKLEENYYFEMEEPSSPSLDDQPPVSTSSEAKSHKRQKVSTPQELRILKRNSQAMAYIPDDETNAMEYKIDEDDDTKFLLSFRGYMRAMNSAQKIDFKLGMLQLVKKIKMGNKETSAQPPCSDE